MGHRPSGNPAVDDGLGGDVETMQSGKGVRFSVKDEARRRRGRAGVGANSRALRELQRRCELEAVAPVEPGCLKYVKKMRKDER